MTRMTRIAAALALILPAATAATAFTPTEPMTLEHFQDRFRDAELIEFRILDVDNDGVLSVLEQRKIDELTIDDS